MKIVFVIGSMSSGGAERVISEMSNYWAKKGWDITIVTIGATKDKKDFYPLDSSINRVDLSLSFPKSKIETIFLSFKLMYKLRKYIKQNKPNVVISFIAGSNIVVLLALLGIKVKKIISDRYDPYSEKIPLWMKRFIYPLSDTLVIQTESVKSFYKTIPFLNMVVIPNPVTYPSIDKKSKKIKFTNPTIVAVGSLNSRKGFDLLIKAFSDINKNYPNWNLVIFGEGKKREFLENIIKEYNLEKKVFLPGVIDNPRSTIIDADIFVLSSLREGFPNVLVEAMSVGLSCVSFDCNFGPSEIIDSKKNGILVEVGNIKKLQVAIEELIKSEELRKQLGDRAREDVIERYYIENVMKQWEQEL